MKGSSGALIYEGHTDPTDTTSPFSAADYPARVLRRKLEELNAEIEALQEEIERTESQQARRKEGLTASIAAREALEQALELLSLTR